MTARTRIETVTLSRPSTPGGQDRDGPGGASRIEGDAGAGITTAAALTTRNLAGAALRHAGRADATRAILRRDTARTRAARRPG